MAEKRKRRLRGPRGRKELFSWLEDEGYTMEQTPASHVAIMSPEGKRIYTTALTPRTDRVDRMASDLRRITGLVLRKSAD